MVLTADPQSKKDRERKYEHLDALLDKEEGMQDLILYLRSNSHIIPLISP